MTSDPSLFYYLEDCKDGKVTFGDGRKTIIVGWGTVEIPGFPKLENILYVKGLKANLISISQLCDVDFVKKFD